jgi:hypothetical protein
MDLGSGNRNPGSGKNLFRIPDPGVKKAPDPGSGSATLLACLPHLMKRLFKNQAIFSLFTTLPVWYPLTCLLAMHSLFAGFVFFYIGEKR